jgi:predicted phosphodiesterase
VTRIGLVSDVHWRTHAPAVESGWHGAKAAPGWHGAGAELRGALARLEHALARFAEHDVELVVLAGDLAHQGELGALAQVLETCARASAPVLVVSGNHDVDGDGDRLVRAHALATAHGRAAGRVRLADPAGEIYAGVLVAGVHVGATHGWFGARLRELPDPARWGGEPLVLASHYPALSLAAAVSDAGFPYPGDLVDRRELAALLRARRAPTLVIGGHVHARASRAEGAVLQLTGGSLVEPPYECALIDVEPLAPGLLAVQRTCLRLREADGAREPVLAPERESWLFDGLEWRTTKRGEGDEAEQREDPHDARRQPAAT